MSTPPPATGPLWAWGSSATRTAVSTAQRLAGFAAGNILTAGTLNQLLYNLGQWVTYLNGPRAPYATLEGAASAMAAGDVATIYENDSATEPGDLLAGYQTGLVYSKIAATSDVFVVAGIEATPKISVFSRAAPGAAATLTWFVSHGGFAHSITIYGNIVAVTYGNWVELFTLSTGASLWAYDHGGATADVQIDGAHTLLVGAAGTGAYEGRLLRTSDGVQTDTITHGASLKACALYGRNAAVAGAPGTGAYNARGFLIGLIGGLTSVWDQAAATGGTFLTLRTDGRLLYGTELGHAYALSWSDGAQIADANILHGAVATSQFMAVDQGGVYVLSTDGATTQLQRLALGSCSYVWQSIFTAAAQTAVATDGARVWSLGTAGGAASGVLTYARGNAVGQWTKVDTSLTTYQRFGWLLVPGVE